ncbi:TPA: chorismate mutase [Pseudomonas putida]
MRPLLLALLCTTALSGCVNATPPSTTFDPLLDSIERRLDVAQAVALHKWDRQQPVQDSPREQQVLLNVSQLAPEHGLDPARATQFFSDQIEANKLRQYHLLTQWHLLEMAPDTPRQDLASEIRPRLDLLQGQLLDALARFDQAPAAQCSQALAEAIALRSSDAPRRLFLIRATANLCQRP